MNDFLFKFSPTKSPYVSCFVEAGYMLSMGSMLQQLWILSFKSWPYYLRDLTGLMVPKTVSMSL